MLEDMAILTGGTVIAEEIGLSLERPPMFLAINNLAR